MIAALLLAAVIPATPATYPTFTKTPTITRTPIPSRTRTPTPQTPTPTPFAVEGVHLPNAGMFPPLVQNPMIRTPGTYRLRYQSENKNGWSNTYYVYLTIGPDPQGQQFRDWIYDLAAKGITSGCGNGNYCPSNPVTRAQMAVFLEKSMAYVAQHPGAFPPGWTPPPCTPPGAFGDVPCYIPTPTRTP